MGSGHALLAPVPAMHIDSALDRCADLGAVAFGTRTYDTFVDRKERGLFPGDPVFIYVSQVRGIGTERSRSRRASSRTSRVILSSRGGSIWVKTVACLQASRRTDRRHAFVTERMSNR